MSKPYWEVWHRKMRVRLYLLLPEWFWVTPFGFFLYSNGVVLDGEPEDCWCGDFELGPDD